jgi:TonB family protein
LNVSVQHSASLKDATSSNRPRSGQRLGRFALVALVVHAEILLMVGVALYWLAPRDAELQARLAASKAPESIDVGMVDDETSQRILADLERRQEEAKAEEVKKEIDSIKAPGQVVDVPVPREERRPDHARFASEHDTSTPIETRKYGQFDEKSRQGDTLGTAEQSRPQQRPDHDQAPPREAPTPTRLALRDPTRQIPGHKAAPRFAEAPQPPGAENGAPGLDPPQPDGSIPRLGNLQMRLGTEADRLGPAPGSSPVTLTPSFAQLARAVGSGTQDALKEIEEGDETALNSKKWRFAAFFNRVKHQVQEHWHPDDVYRRRDPTGAIHGRTNRLTIVRVQLNPNGNLANVALETASGLEFLDDEALQAFRAAQPFPNPPRQLIDQTDGLISFQFGFLFEISGVSRPMLFKYNM